MCGIAGIVGTAAAAGRMLDAVAHRGPDGRGVVRCGSWSIGHVRLSIIDPTEASAQPMKRGATTLTYNGELWNAAELRAAMKKAGRTFTTAGDTEVVAHVLDEWGYDGLARMQGMFALAWESGGVVSLARDRFGEVPIHYSSAGTPAFASEVKALTAAGVPASAAFDVPPGGVVRFSGPYRSAWRWYTPPHKPAAVGLEEASVRLRAALAAAVAERSVSDVPVCCLLSGGIDSAVIAALLRRHVKELTAYTAVMDPNSADLKSARKTAAALGVRLIEVAVRPPTADDLAGVVRRIEMPHKAQVEIGWACVALAGRMRSDGFKVTFSGEGSDELWASYGFAYHGVQAKGWHAYRKDLFLSQSRKNFPRCNKVFLSSGVECRLPFLSTPVVELALSLPRDAVVDRKPGGIKAVLREASRGVVPDHVLARPKVAFQDGMGLKAAAAAAVAEPKRFYASVYQTEFPGRRP